MKLQFGTSPVVSLRYARRVDYSASHSFHSFDSMREKESAKTHYTKCEHAAESSAKLPSPSFECEA